MFVKDINNLQITVSDIETSHKNTVQKQAANRSKPDIDIYLCRRTAKISCTRHSRTLWFVSALVCIIFAVERRKQAALGIAGLQDNCILRDVSVTEQYGVAAIMRRIVLIASINACLTILFFDTEKRNSLI